MKKIIILILMTYQQLLMARDNLAELEAKQLIQARTTQEIEKINIEFSKIRGAREACRAQLVLKIAPTKCFQVLDSEKSLGLISTAQFVREQSWLRRTAASFISESNQINVLRAILRDQHIPIQIKDQAKDRIEEINYQAVSHRSADLFDSRFRNWKRDSGSVSSPQEVELAERLEKLEILVDEMSKSKPERKKIRDVMEMSGLEYCDDPIECMRKVLDAVEKERIKITQSIEQ